MRRHKQAATDKPPGGGFLSWDLEGSHSGALLAFQRLMSGRSGFSLILLQYNDPVYRDKVIPYLNHYAAKPEVFRLDSETEYSEFEKHLLGASAGHDLIQVIGLNQWLAGESRKAKFRGFNYHRELLAEKVRATLALWMTESDIRDFALEAPDMWAWRKGVVDFSVSRQDRSEVELSRLDLGSADVSDRQRRMKEIETYLAVHPEGQVSQANLLRELGQIYRNLGRIDAALKALTDAGAIYNRNDHKREHMFVQSEIARIYSDMGNVDEALKLHEEVLEGFEKLEDRHSWAVTLGDIARIYVSKGNVDEALKLQNEELKVYEQLGDKRSRAVALGDIARIYVDRGNVDEALTLQNEALKVFEQLERQPFASRCAQRYRPHSSRERRR